MSYLSAAELSDWWAKSRYSKCKAIWLSFQARDILETSSASNRGPQHAEQPGRICANILIKLVLDLWNTNEASTSFPLALMLLSG